MLVQRAPSHQRRLEGCVDRSNDRVNVRVPVVEITCKLLGRAFSPPGFDLPTVSFERTYEIHDLAAANGIVQHMAMRSEPIGRGRGGDV
jgi:hypothetical protein